MSKNLTTMPFGVLHGITAVWESVDAFFLMADGLVSR